MKVKPFYIRTAGLTEKQVGEAMDKCISAGAEAYEGVSAYHADSDFQAGLMIFDSWRFFGVDASNGTYFEDDDSFFGGEEITLDQLDEWLGLDKAETPEGKEALDSMANDSWWKSGDRVTIKNPEGFGTWDEAERYLGTNGTVMAVFTNTNGKKVAAVSHDDSVCICWMLSMLSKPETPQQREERERLEAAIYLIDGNPNSQLCMWENASKEFKEHILWIVDKTGYRKAK